MGANSIVLNDYPETHCWWDLLQNSLKNRMTMLPKLVITDIDGVWTDGGMYYTAEGDV